MPEEDIQKLSVVIPCFNEKGNAERFEREIFKGFDRYPFQTEIFLIDDGSTDGTTQLLERLEKENPFLRVIKHEGNKGLGEALRSGFKKATGDAVLVLDADLTFHPNQFCRLVDVYGPSVDCVMGSPLLGEMRDVSTLRRFLSRGVNRIYQFLLGVPLTATSSIFRLYRASTLKSLSLESRSFNINAEILFQILKKGGVVREVPVTLSRRVWGESKINIVREIKNHVWMFLKIGFWRLERP